MEGSASGKDRLIPADRVKYQLHAKLLATEVKRASWLWETSRMWQALVFTFEAGEAVDGEKGPGGHGGQKALCEQRPGGGAGVVW